MIDLILNTDQDHLNSVLNFNLPKNLFQSWSNFKVIKSIDETHVKILLIKLIEEKTNIYGVSIGTQCCNKIIYRKTIQTPSTLSSPSKDLSMRFKPLKLPTGPESLKIEVESYFSPPTSIQKFHEEFTVPKGLYRKFKDGLRIWTKGGCVRTQGYRQVLSPCLGAQASFLNF
ncbi:hypothetical protein BpHYR1_005541 [Brachionus plicatilis]|uniref:Uncharacterized protein n=1 Tax=Brachionus plicatilis TaxID=10195 RepID=A0A3M7SGN3_BRAPC|nr:hypothetical protein BpHYR1_005541 [Brachionus plicatilis]